MILTDLILFHYYKLFSKDGFAKDLAYGPRSGWQAPEDKAFNLFCLAFICWLLLVAWSINYLLYQQFSILTGYIALILAIPFYLVYNKKYKTDYEIIGVYEKNRLDYKSNTDRKAHV